MRDGLKLPKGFGDSSFMKSLSGQIFSRGWGGVKHEEDRKKMKKGESKAIFKKKVKAVFP